MMKRILAIFALLGLLVPVTSFAQTGAVTGTVTDAESGATLPGVNVVLQEINQGAAANVEGVYTIEDVPPGTYTLEATFVGYDAFEAQVTIEPSQRVTQDIELPPETVGLDEVVVTGYGQEQTVGELTGSVSNVDAEEIESVPSQNIGSVLQGRTAGTQISFTSGNPGAGFNFDIRGQGSIDGSNRPLYIVDGIQLSFDQNTSGTDRSPLNGINNRDIESIQILKDAAAAAIYGAQAANGVVLIETKSGRSGETRVSLEFEGGVRYQSDRWNLMNRDEWLDFQTEAFGESVTRNGIIAGYGYDPDTDFSDLRDYNWQEWLFEPGSHASAGFTAQGGDENTNFYLSGSWTNTGGALAAGAVDYRQYSVRSNVGQQFTENLDVSLNLSLSSQKNEGVCQDGFFINCPFYQAIGEEAPISFPYNEDGTYNPNTEQSALTNPALVLNEEKRVNRVTQFLGTLQPTYQIASWLSAEGSFGLDWQQAKDRDYESTVRNPGQGAALARSQNWITNVTLNGTLNANRTFGDIHDVSGVVGTEYRQRYEDDNSLDVVGFGNDFLTVASAASSADGVPTGFNDEFRQLSYFGRANYTFDQRYIVTLSGRYDGSSRFGDQKRWGFFPSASFGWRVSEEAFFNAGFVDDLKVRVSYGVTGNSAGIGDFQNRGLYSISDSYSGRTGIRPDQLENAQLSWEEKRSTNVGVDYALFGGRVNGNLNLYRSISDNLLLDRPLPQSSGFGEITENAGKVQNQGIEFEVETINVQTEDFSWSTRFNVSVRQNEVKELSRGQEKLDDGGILPTAVGQPIDAFEIERWAGVNPADGRPLYLDADGNLTYQPDTEDTKFFDAGQEDVIGGFGTAVSYKGFSLDAFFDFSYGQHALQNTLRSYSIAFGENVWGELTNRWSGPGDTDAEWPRSEPFGSFDSAQSPDAFSTYWLFRTQYVRLKNLRFSYRLPGTLAERAGLRGARVYVEGINLVDWQSAPGIEPGAAGAFEEGDYPVEQQINVGVELDL